MVMELMPHKDLEMRRKWQKAYLERKLKEDPDWKKRIQQRYRDKPENKIKAIEYQRRKRKENPELYNQRFRDYRKRNPEKFKEWDRKQREKHHDKILERQKNWHEKNKQRELEYRKRTKEHKNGKTNAKRKNDRIRALSGYSNGFLKCVCCGIIIIEFLEIDHIKGRKEMAKDPELVKLGYKQNLQGKELYTWLIRSGFPEGFQVLCSNCNKAKGQYGKCPHQKKN